MSPTNRWIIGRWLATQEGGVLEARDGKALQRLIDGSGYSGARSSLRSMLYNMRLDDELTMVTHGNQGTSKIALTELGRSRYGDDDELPLDTPASPTVGPRWTMTTVEPAEVVMEPEAVQVPEVQEEIAAPSVPSGPLEIDYDALVAAVRRAQEEPASWQLERHRLQQQLAKLGKDNDDLKNRLGLAVAETEQQRRRAQAAEDALRRQGEKPTRRSGRNHGQPPRLKVTDYQRILDAVHSAPGWRAEPTPQGNHKIYPPDVQEDIVVISPHSKDYHGLANAVARLRRAGLAV